MAFASTWPFVRWTFSTGSFDRLLCLLRYYILLCLRSYGRVLRNFSFGGSNKSKIQNWRRRPDQNIHRCIPGLCDRFYAALWSCTATFGLASSKNRLIASILTFDNRVATLNYRVAAIYLRKHKPLCNQSLRPKLSEEKETMNF